MCISLDFNNIYKEKMNATLNISCLKKLLSPYCFVPSRVCTPNVVSLSVSNNIIHIFYTFYRVSFQIDSVFVTTFPFLYLHISFIIESASNLAS